jgi:hypothetical protein
MGLSGSREHPEPAVFPSDLHLVVLVRHAESRDPLEGPRSSLRCRAELTAQFRCPLAFGGICRMEPGCAFRTRGDFAEASPASGKGPVLPPHPSFWEFQLIVERQGRNKVEATLAQMDCCGFPAIATLALTASFSYARPRSAPLVMLGIPPSFASLALRQ